MLDAKRVLEQQAVHPTAGCTCANKAPRRTGQPDEPLRPSTADAKASTAGTVSFAQAGRRLYVHATLASLCVVDAAPARAAGVD